MAFAKAVIAFTLPEFEKPPSRPYRKDMIWDWIIAYDLWSLAYTYNCIADQSFYCGAVGPVTR